jgi:ATP phosphoribosyltransferase
MRAAGLHAISTILTSEAILIRSSSPPPSSLPLIERISSRLAGVIAASRYVLCNYNVPRELVPEVIKITPGRRAPTVSPLDDDGWFAVSAMVQKECIADTMDRLQAIGAADILVIHIVSRRSRSHGFFLGSHAESLCPCSVKLPSIMRNKKGGQVLGVII